MNRMTRNALAGALAAAVALGTAAPAAVAAPKAGHAKVHKKSAKAHKSVKAEKVTKAERRLAAEQRKLSTQARNKDRQLGQKARWVRTERLEGTVRDAVLLNIREDRGEVGELGTTARSATREDLKSLASDLRTIRPDAYNFIVNRLHQAASLESRLSETAEADPALTTQIDPALAQVDLVVETLLTYDADTTRAEKRTVIRALSSVRTALEEATETPETETPDTGTDTETDTTAG